MDMMLLVKCPDCGKCQKCSPKGDCIKSKVKLCVYCGRHFKIFPNINSSRIIQRLS